MEWTGPESVELWMGLESELRRWGVVYTQVANREPRASFRLDQGAPPAHGPRARCAPPPRAVIAAAIPTRLQPPSLSIQFRGRAWTGAPTTDPGDTANGAAAGTPCPAGDWAPVRQQVPRISSRSGVQNPGFESRLQSPSAV